MTAKELLNIEFPPEDEPEAAYRRGYVDGFIVLLNAYVNAGAKTVDTVFAKTVEAFIENSLEYWRNGDVSDMVLPPDIREGLERRMRAERNLHREFKPQCVGGEWYDLTVGDIAHIRDCYPEYYDDATRIVPEDEDSQLL